MSLCDRCKNDCKDNITSICPQFQSTRGGKRPNSGKPKGEEMDRFQVTILKTVSNKIGRKRLRVLLIEAAEVELKK